MTTPDDTKPTTTTSEVTKEQLDAVNARLDAHERQQAAAVRLARNRSAAEKFAVRVEPDAPTMFREDCVELAVGAVDSAHRADPEIQKLSGDVKSAFDTMLSDGQAMDNGFAHLKALATGLEYGDRERTFPMMAATWVFESKRLTDAHIKRYDRVTKHVDGEIAHLEKQAQMHATLARNEILVPNLSAHVAQEIRQHFRSMSAKQRHDAVYQAVEAGDKETLTALTERGVPRYLLGIDAKDASYFDALIERAETKFAPQHVARRDAARVFAERLKNARARFHAGSERFSEFAMMAKNPALKQRVEAIGKMGAS